MDANEAYYIVHRGRPGHCKESTLVRSLDSAKRIAKAMLARASAQRLPGLAGFTRGKMRDLGDGRFAIQAGRYSLRLPSVWATGDGRFAK